MNLQSVLQIVFGAPASIPLMPSGDEQIPLSNCFPNFSTKGERQIIEPVPIHLVEIQLFLHREREAMRTIIKRIKAAGESTPRTVSIKPIDTDGPDLRDLVRKAGRPEESRPNGQPGIIQQGSPDQGSKTSMVNIDILARNEQRCLPPGTNPGDSKAISEISYNVNALNELFHLLDKNHRAHNINTKVPIHLVINIEYDPGTKALVYVSRPREEVKARGNNNDGQLEIIGTAGTRV